MQNLAQNQVVTQASHRKIIDTGLFNEIMLNIWMAKSLIDAIFDNDMPADIQAVLVCLDREIKEAETALEDAELVRGGVQ